MAKRTIIEIADRVGVSPATVSRALNNVAGVSPDKRQQILAVAAELNYHPNAIARRLQGQRTNTLAYLAGIRDHPTADLFFFKDFITTLAERCLHYEMDLLIHPLMQDAQGAIDVAAALRSGRADGLILTDICHDDQRIEALLAQQMPFVAFGRSGNGQLHSYVDVDGEWGIHAATSHLIARGHQRIGFVGLPEQYSCAGDRYAGFCRALREHALPHNPAMIVQDVTNETETSAAITQLLALPSPPTAFVTSSDMLAVYAMSAAAKHGLVAGRDYAITGFDDLPLAAHTSPPLTTVRQPLRQVCDELIVRLVRQIADSHDTASIMLQPELIVRGSS